MEHLYIHWPFCKNKCYYCDFVSFQNHEGFEKEYHDALCKQIERCARDTQSNKPIKTIFMGGGTPSLYPLSLMEELYKTLQRGFDITSVKEWTIEVNPAGVTKEHLQAWRDFGVNRLSMGVQVLDDQVLKNMNRMQKEQDVLDLLSLAPSYFKNISVDLILGLPGTTNAIWKQTVQKILSFSIQHISIYLLMVYNKTPLFFKVQSKQLSLLDEDDMVSLYNWTIDLLKESGFDQYELSNFAKPGFESIHNKSYWDRKPYQGFGVGASSFDGSSRIVNEKNLFYYIRNCNEKDGLVDLQVENLTVEQVFLERLMLQLRQKKGVDLHSMLYFLKGSKRDKFLNGIRVLEEKFLIHNHGGRISLTVKGMMLENEVILHLV